MGTLIYILIIGVFLFLSLIHFYWAFGGKWGLKNALPQSEKGETLFQPSAFASIIVGIGLFLMGLFFVFKGGWITLVIPEFILFYGQYVIGGIFLLRAIGDFKHVGFFKKIRNTSFSKNDSKIFSPLCLLLGILCLSSGGF